MDETCASSPVSSKSEKPDTAAKRDRALYRYLGGWGLAVAPLFWGGQVIQKLKDASGEHIFPEFFRHHLTNIVDPIALFPPAILAVEAMPLKRSQKMLAASFLVAGLGIGWEAFQAQLPKRSFDYVDTACYLVTSFAFATGLRRHLREIGADYAESRSSLFKPDHTPL